MIKVILFIILFLSSASAQTSPITYYIRAGATGNNSGSDWTNAFPDFPGATSSTAPTMVRGATYYVASGNYGSYLFNTPESGTSVITIKKATTTDYGTSVGWNASYGTGQAVFGNAAHGIAFATGYWTFDGNISSGLDPTGYGFTFLTQVTTNGEAYLNISQGQAATFNGLTFRNISITCDGPNDTGGSVGINPATISDLESPVIQYVYINNCNDAVDVFGNNWLIEHSYFLNDWSSSTHHGVMIDVQNTYNKPIGNSSTFRYNYVQGCTYSCIESNGWAGTGVASPTINGWNIYGNIFIPQTAGTDGIVSASDTATVSNTNIYNNTIISTTMPLLSEQDPGGPGTSGNVVENNLFYNVQGYFSLFNTNGASPIVHGYNSYWSSNWNWQSSDTVSTDQTVATGNPFVNLSAGNYNLAKDTQAGLNLGASYNMDPNGFTRGNDGVWDIGAYQYVPGPQIYIAQSVSGNANGTDCADAYSVTWFNTASNWGTAAGQIGPGTTVHLCGTITTAITVLGSGTSGNPITIFFEPNAKISAPTWTSAIITIYRYNYIIVDGGQNGIIEATDNGTNLDYQNSITGVNISGSQYSELKHLTIQNLYMRPANSTDEQSANGILVDGTNDGYMPSSYTSIHDNTITWVTNGINWEFDTGGTNASIYSNTIRYMSTGIIFGSRGNSSTFSYVDISNNDISDAYVWDQPSDYFHHDGVHFWGNGPDVTGLQIHGNYIHGNWGTYVTAQLYFEGQATNYLVYNNILNADFRHIYTKLIGPGYIYNNTIYDGGGYGFVLDSLTGTQVYFQNNIYFDTAGMGFNGNSGNNPNVVSNNNLTIDPLYVNPSAGDFHLQAGSSAIGAGANLSSYCSSLPALCKDKDGNTRPATGAWDIGAYQYSSANTGSAILGDVNGDGSITMADADFTAQAAIGETTLTSSKTQAAEVDGTNTINIYDAYLIAERAANLITTFPAQGGG